MNSSDETSDSPEEKRTIAVYLLKRAEKQPDLLSLLVERWARAETWTRLEGIALAWTLDPARTTVRSKSTYMDRDPRQLPEEAQHYLDLAKRARSLDMFHDRVAPARFIAWAESVGLAFHPDWKASLLPPPPKPPSAAEKARATLIRRWARMPYWSVEEGAALSVDADPKKAITWNPSGYGGPSVQISDDGLHLLDLARRAVEMDALSERPTPREFLNWADGMGQAFPADWREVVQARPEATPAGPPYPGGITNVDREYDDKMDPILNPPSPALPKEDLNPKERISLLKLVIGMAVGGYGFDPRKQRNDATADIVSDLDRAGVSLDPGTVLKWLRDAAEHLPPPDRD